GTVGVLHEEPGALDVVAGVDDAALGDHAAEFAVGAHVLQGAAQLRLEGVLKNILHALGGSFIINSLLLLILVHTAQDGGDVQIDHGVGQAAAAAGLGNGLGAQARGVLNQALVQLPDQIIGGSCPLQAGLVAGDAVIFGVGN